jgi:hypothetical protein
LDVTAKEFEPPAPVPLPDFTPVMLTIVYFANEGDFKTDGRNARIGDELDKWKRSIAQFDATHRLPSLLQGMRDGKLTVYCDGHASASEGQSAKGRQKNVNLSHDRAINVEEEIVKRFGAKVKSQGHGIEMAKWTGEVNKKTLQLALKPRAEDRAVLISMKYDELEKYLRGQL